MNVQSLAWLWTLGRLQTVEFLFEYMAKVLFKDLQKLISWTLNANIGLTNLVVKSPDPRCMLLNHLNKLDNVWDRNLVVVVPFTYGVHCD